MKILIVYAHPSEKSFNFALKKAIKDGAMAANCEVLESDLYRMNFKPELDQGDYPSYEDEEFDIQKAQIKANADGIYERELQIEIDKVSQAEIIFLQFPIWWSTCPAIMTGWIQRVFPHWPHPTFQNKKLLISTTAGNDYSEKEIEDVLLHLKQPFNEIGIEILPSFFVFSVNGTTEAQREQSKTDLRNLAFNLIHNNE